MLRDFHSIIQAKEIKELLPKEIRPSIEYVIKGRSFPVKKNILKGYQGGGSLANLREEVQLKLDQKEYAKAKELIGKMLLLGDKSKSLLLDSAVCSYYLKEKGEAAQLFISLMRDSQAESSIRLLALLYLVMIVQETDTDKALALLEKGNELLQPQIGYFAEEIQANAFRMKYAESKKEIAYKYEKTDFLPATEDSFYCLQILADIDMKSYFRSQSIIKQFFTEIMREDARKSGSLEKLMCEYIAQGMYELYLLVYLVMGEDHIFNLH